MKRTIPPAIVEDRERDGEAEKCRTKIREKRKREKRRKDKRESIFRENAKERSSKDETHSDSDRL